MMSSSLNICGDINLIQSGHALCLLINMDKRNMQFWKLIYLELTNLLTIPSDKITLMPKNIELEPQLANDPNSNECAEVDHSTMLSFNILWFYKNKACSVCICDFMQIYANKFACKYSKGTFFSCSCTKTLRWDCI